LAASVGCARSGCNRPRASRPIPRRTGGAPATGCQTGRYQRKCARDRGGRSRSVVPRSPAGASRPYTTLRTSPVRRAAGTIFSSSLVAVATPLSMRRCWSGAWCLWLVAAMLTGAARGGDALTVAVLGWRGCAGAGAELFRVGCSCLHQRSRLRSAAPVRLRMDGGREGRRRRRDEDEVQGRRRAIDAENTLGSRGYKEWLLLTVAIGFIACALLVRTLVSADRACKCIWTRRLRVIKGAREEARKRGRGKGGTRSIERRCRHVHRRGRVYR